MTEYSRMAKGHFIATSGSKVINLPFQPDFVEVWNYTNYKTPATNGVIRAYWDNTLLDGANNPTMIEMGTATPGLNTDVILTNGISAFSGGLALQYGPVYQHTGSTDFQISKASTAVVTTTTNHNLQTGDVVIFSSLNQTATTGMQQIAGIPFMITRTAATTFTINWDTSGSNYTAFNSATSTGNVGSYKQVLYPDLYFPGDIFISGITTGATTTVTTTTQHNFVVGQEVGFRIPVQWGPIQLNELPNVFIPGSPIYGYVIAITDLQTVVVNINSSAFTAFNANQPFASAGRSFPQVVAVGDVNTGGVQISANSPLYPSPLYSYATSKDTSTINGPAIQGAYVNNTRQGFVIGSGASNSVAAAVIMVSTNIIEWRAYLHDMSIPT